MKWLAVALATSPSARGQHGIIPRSKGGRRVSLICVFGN